MKFINFFVFSLFFFVIEALPTIGVSVKTTASTNSSEILPTTAGITCPSPVSPLNGYIKGDQYDAGSIIHLMCNDGFFRRGYPFAVCKKDGRWTDSNVTCIARSCGDPGMPFNGKRIGMMFQYSNTVSFSCNKGYFLEGPATRTCQANRTWSDSQPICRPIPCGEPPSISHSKLFLYGEGGLVYKNQIEYVCKPGYYREGNQKIYCGDDGKWHGILPVCKEVRCPRPKVLLNGAIQMDNNTEGSIVRFFCNPGYTLFGSHWRKCLKTGQWTGPEPTCFECARVGTPVFVRKPSHFKHGTVQSKSGNQVTVYYEAEDEEEDILVLGKGTQHYAMVEDRIPSKSEIFNGTRVLAVNSQDRKFMLGTVRMNSGSLYGVQFDGRNDHQEVPLDNIRTLEPPRFCSTCSDPGRPAFSSREDDLMEFIPGMEVIYTCEYTYKMTGSQTRLCQQDGTWTGTTPKCTISSCDDLDAFPPRNGKRAGNNFTIGSTLEFSCDDGYALVGQRQLTCTMNGSWSHLPPVCKNVCDDFKCNTVGEKCQYVKDVGPRCVCRENEDCRALYEPVCGSDGNSYNSHCIMSATACRTGKTITMVDEGGCVPGGLCQIVPYSVCRGYFPRYFFNSTSQQCQYFIAGGCHPSGWNGFQTKQLCNHTCLGDICKQPVNRGPCTQKVSRWTFDSVTGRCKRFNYGGCYGNENNFLSKQLCLRRCRPGKVAARGSCPNCVRVRLHQACQNSNLAILARVISALPKDEKKHLLRYHLVIHQVIKDTSSSVTKGKTIISVPYGSTTNCSCLHIPMNKKFVLIGGIATDKTADSKSGVIVSPQSYTSGWNTRVWKQIEKKCGSQLIVPRDFL
ncbi:CUB and sushi domain-containing protein 3-like [Actinia tenebrosa]|uniref:CUB and sushi domain-containing protein 3-like n=1 Tax=Actinia tenebrosa TaxID=6105 RepID=A0A6P8J4X4_ACTTE|nr:CUB and sushi domain-containing protein 3-like [Actinia tenebrosa]